VRRGRIGRGRRGRVAQRAFRCIRLPFTSYPPQVRNLVIDALLALVTDIRTARDGGATIAQLAAARDEQRQAPFLVDFIEAENSMGFDAPQEAMRVLALSIDHARLGQQALRTGRTSRQRARAVHLTASRVSARTA
jgi:hypothetical protein